MAEDVVREQQRQIDRILAARNHYEVLELRFGPEIPPVTDEEIEKAYRQFARKLHPDKCHLEGAAEAFKSVKLAQDTLLDPEKRTKNDYLVGLNGGFRGDLDSNIDFQHAGDFADDFQRPESGYCGALFQFAVIVATMTVAFSHARLKAELPAVPYLVKGQYAQGYVAIPLLATIAEIVILPFVGFSWWGVFKWCATTYYGWTAFHLVPWVAVIAWQTQNATNLLGLPIWMGLLSAALARFTFHYELLSSMYLGLCMTILLGIACLRYSSPLWALAKGFGLLIVVALGDVDSGIATTLIILIAFLGSTRDGGTAVWVALALLLIYVAFRIHPVLCVFVLFLSTIKSEDGELMILLCGLILVITMSCFGETWVESCYWLVFLCIEGAACKWWAGKWLEGRGWGHKRVVAAIALVGGMQGIGKASLLEGLGVVAFMFFVCSGISKVLKYDESFSRGGGEEYESKKQADSAKRAKKEEKKNAKKEAKKDRKGQKKR